MILDVPRIKCFVDRSFLTNDELAGLEECYLFAVTLIESRPILWTIHTIYGAVYSRIPTWALRCGKSNDTPLTPKGISDVDQWGAISSEAQIISHQYLKDYEVSFKGMKGRYLFTIDYFGGGFSEDPEQHKTTNIIAGYDKLFYCLPNNECVFKDKHFTNDLKPDHYRRNQNYFTL